MVGPWNLSSQSHVSDISIAERMAINSLVYRLHLPSSLERFIASTALPILVSYDVSCQFFRAASRDEIHDESLDATSSASLQRRHDEYLHRYIASSHVE